MELLPVNQDYQIERIIATDSEPKGELTPSRSSYLAERQQRDYQTFVRTQRDRSIWNASCGIALVLMGVSAVFVFGAVLVTALRPVPAPVVTPPPPPPVNPNCWMFCRN